MDSNSRAAFEEVFKAFDSNSDGHISAQEYCAVLNLLTTGGISRLPFMFSRMDRNNDGTIEIDEFLDGRPCPSPYSKPSLTPNMHGPLGLLSGGGTITRLPL